MAKSSKGAFSRLDDVYGRSGDRRGDVQEREFRQGLAPEGEVNPSPSQGGEAGSPTPPDATQASASQTAGQNEARATASARSSPDRRQRSPAAYPWEEVEADRFVTTTARLSAPLREQIRYVSENVPPAQAGSFNRIVERAVTEFVERRLRELGVPEDRL